MTQSKGQTNSVLYQKLGSTWYAFSTGSDGEVIFSPLPDGITPHSHDLELYELVEEESTQKSSSLRLEKRAEQSA